MKSADRPRRLKTSSSTPKTSDLAVNGISCFGVVRPAATGGAAVTPIFVAGPRSLFYRQLVDPDWGGWSGAWPLAFLILPAFRPGEG
jgi:hypothetical protein